MFPPRQLAFLVLFAYSVVVTASTRRDDAPPLNCNEILKLATKEEYDLSILAGEHTASRTRDTPPTKMEDALRFDLCADLSTSKDVKPEDQVRCGNPVSSIFDELIASYHHSSVSERNPCMLDENEQERLRY